MFSWIKNLFGGKDETVQTEATPAVCALPDFNACQLRAAVEPVIEPVAAVEPVIEPVAVVEPVIEPVAVCGIVEVIAEVIATAVAAPVKTKVVKESKPKAVKESKPKAAKEPKAVAKKETKPKPTITIISKPKKKR